MHVDKKGRWLMCHTHRAAGLAVVAVALLVVPGRAHAQKQKRHEDGRSEPRESWLEHEPDMARRELSPQQLRDYGFPDPDRPWGRPRYLDRDRRWPRSSLRHYSRPRRYSRYYYDDYTYRFGVPRDYDPHAYDLERAYRQGVADGQGYERFEIQAERGLATYQQAMAAGHFEFAGGRYRAAMREFLLAASVNQGDPASRICAAHTCFALGDYETAVRLLRRAVELQPKWPYLPMDIRGAYGTRADFAKHLKALHGALERDVGNADLWFLLGYCCYYSNQMDEAAEALGNAAKLHPEDRLFAQFADLVGLARPRLSKPTSQRESRRPGHDL
jgi:tetratricopeptide (TPR) repeat protein